MVQFRKERQPLAIQRDGRDMTGRVVTEADILANHGSSREETEFVRQRDQFPDAKSHRDAHAIRVSPEWLGDFSPSAEVLKRLAFRCPANRRLTEFLMDRFPRGKRTKIRATARNERRATA